MTVVKFPYDACRRVHSRKPRRSKNGTPEERAAAAAADASPPADVVSLHGGNQPEPAPDVAPYSGLPIMRPKPGEDLVFHEIERHRAAVVAYNQAIEAENADEENEALQAATSAAYDDVMRFGRFVAITTAKTRRGLICQTSYLASQFNALGDFENGCTYMPEEINGKPWPLVFLTSLARQLRRMGPELEPAKRSTRAKAETIPQMGRDEWRKAVGLFIGLETKGMASQAVKCLQMLLTMPTSGAAMAARRGKGVPAVSSAELRAEFDRLDPGDRRYMEGYLQGMVDGRST
jgi:hypothetical protein